MEQMSEEYGFARVPPGRVTSQLAGSHERFMPGD